MIDYTIGSVCPLTADNAGLINESSIAMMKDGVMLINTSRGKLIRTKDLIEGLKSGKIGSAGGTLPLWTTSASFDQSGNRGGTPDVGSARRNVLCGTRWTPDADHGGKSHVDSLGAGSGGRSL